MNESSGPPPAQTETEDVIRLLSAQRDLYALLGRLADRQRGLITGNEPEQLLKVIAERQRVLAALGKVTERLRPYQQRWQELRGRMSGEQLAAADALVKDMQRELAAIIAKDEADVQLLAARKEAASQSIAGLKRGRDAGVAYAASAAAASTGGEWMDS
jgi:hypothetical protein